MAPVRAALLSVKGVTRARVTLENHEAIVTYDPAQTTIEAVIASLKDAIGPGGQEYSATVKPPPLDSN